MEASHALMSIPRRKGAHVGSRDADRTEVTDAATELPRDAAAGRRMLSQAKGMVFLVGITISLLVSASCGNVKKSNDPCSLDRMIGYYENEAGSDDEFRENVKKLGACIDDNPENERKFKEGVLSK